MDNEWELQVEAHQAMVNEAVNIILGMTMIRPATIDVIINPADSATWFARISDGVDYDHQLLCESRSAAEALADEIYCSVLSELIDLPPFPRKQITRKLFEVDR